jgi:hypothetical protein
MPNKIVRTAAAGTVGALTALGVGYATEAPAPQPATELSPVAPKAELIPPATAVKGPLDSTKNTNTVPNDGLDSRYPWQHEADLVGVENATPTILARVAIAEKNGWKIEGNNQGNGQGAFVKMTSPSGVEYNSGNADFNGEVNLMLDDNAVVKQPKDSSQDINNNPELPNDF